jgi:hypothetical protein
MARITNIRLAKRGTLVLGLVLAFAVLFGSREITVAQTQTINLNTGYNQVSSALIPFLLHDDDWKVTLDDINPPTVPRPAFVVNNLPLSGHFKWPTPFANSSWISADANKYNGSLQPPRKHFTYEICFNLPPAFSAPQLTMQLRADDIVRQVRLNGVIFNDPDPNAAASATKPGSHLGPPLPITWSQSTSFQGGQNCLEVDVEDVQQIITGLDVAGSVTYQPVGVSLPPCSGSGSVVLADLSTGTTSGVKNALATVDPKWKLIKVPPSTPGLFPAYSTGIVTSFWVSNGPQQANWIQRKQNVNPQQDAPGPYTYRVQFGLNTSLYSNVYLILLYAADNAAVVQLNSANIGSCLGPNCYSSWQGPLLWQSPGFLPTGFSNGLNSLDMIVTNNSPTTGQSNTGLIVDARLIAICK